MSGWKGHILFPLILVGLVFLVSYFLGYLTIDMLNNEIFLWGIGVIILYSLLADLDIPTSFASTLFSIGVGISGIYFLYIYFTGSNPIALYIGLALFALVLGKVFLRHRGAAHSIIMGCILVSPFLILYLSSNNPTYIFFIIVGFLGFFSHILLDCI